MRKSTEVCEAPPLISLFSANSVTQVSEIPNSSTASSMQTDQNAEPVYIATVTMHITAVTVHFVASGQFTGFYMTSDKLSRDIVAE